jgi:hypothetical protein
MTHRTSSVGMDTLEPPDADRGSPPSDADVLPVDMLGAGVVATGEW